jgi:hypothetical protein
MPPDDKRAFFVPLASWEGRHQSYHQAVEGQYSFTVYRSPDSPAARLAAYNEITREFQDLIAQAIRDGKSLRPYGSSWSLSTVAVTEHNLINTKALRIGFTLPAGHIDPGYGGDVERLRFFECGATLASVNPYLFKDRLSLHASGSNNGQTLVGAAATGTHGSAFKFGSTQDFIVGLHLITGPSRQVYLERASQPVMAASFAASLGAELIRDDTLFNAALVSFGSFGIIHGIMIETRPVFLLHAYRSFQPFGSSLHTAMTTLNFSDLPLPEPASSLYHFQVTVNPNDAMPPTEASVLTMFEHEFTPHYTPPAWDDMAGGPGAAGIEAMGELLDSVPHPLTDIVKPILNTQVRNQLAPYTVQGTMMDLFHGEKVHGKVMAVGVAVPLSRTIDTLNVALRTYVASKTLLPLLLTFRFVKATQALMGFTKFEPTAVLDIDLLNTDKAKEYVDAVWHGLEEAGIPFTLHWGKLNWYLTRPRLERMYGENLTKWIESRETILSPDVRSVFTNPFLRDIGLTA